MKNIGQKIGFLLHTYPILENKYGYKVYEYNKYKEIKKQERCGNCSILVNTSKERLSDNEWIETGKKNYIKNSFYSTFKIPKNSKDKLGNTKYRYLNSPSGVLRKIQDAIKTQIFDNFTFPKYITGFVKGGSPKVDALQHPNTKWSIRIDFKDYFTTVKFSHVRDALMYFGYDLDTASIIAELCTFKGFLPQGTITSPFLANLVGYAYFDKMALAVASRFKLRYTRYADDMFFSSDKIQDPSLKSKLMKFVSAIVNISGFRLNYQKCHKLGKFNHHKRMGEITIHGEIPKISNKKYIDPIRININRLEHKDLSKVLNQFKNENNLDYVSFDTFMKKIKGKISYVSSVYPERGKALFNKLYSVLVKIGLKEYVPEGWSFIL